MINQTSTGSENPFQQKYSKDSAFFQIVLTAKMMKEHIGTMQDNGQPLDLIHLDILISYKMTTWLRLIEIDSIAGEPSIQ